MTNVFNIVLKIRTLKYICNENFRENSFNNKKLLKNNFRENRFNSRLIEDSQYYLNINTVASNSYMVSDLNEKVNLFDKIKNECLNNKISSNKLLTPYFSFNDYRNDLFIRVNSFNYFVNPDFLSQFSGLTKKSYFLHYVTLHNFLESISKSKVVIVNRSSLNKNSNHLNVVNNAYFFVKRMYRRSVKKFNLYNFLYILASSLASNDIILFKNFVSKKMSSIRFKRHKRLLSMFRYAFRLVTSFFINRGLIKGFFLTISGKIGIGGSVKRKVWKYTRGSVNLSRKKSKVKYQLFQIWTATGCLGCRLGLSF